MYNCFVMEIFRTVWKQYILKNPIYREYKNSNVINIFKYLIETPPSTQQNNITFYSTSSKKNLICSNDMTGEGVNIKKKM